MDKQITNAEKIRLMNDDELLEFLINFYKNRCDFCTYCECDSYDFCEQGLLEWLESEGN